MIKIKNAEEFESLLTAMSKDIVDAQMYFNLYRGLDNALLKNPSVENKSNTFWSLTLTAHISTSIHILCRLYDQVNETLNLYSFLKTIKENPDLFMEREFYDRLKGVNSLPKYKGAPNIEVLEQDIRYCHKSDPLVKTLIINRGQRFVHRNAKHVVTKRGIGGRQLTIEHVEKLLKRAIDILNRYSDLYNANTYSTQPFRHDDYKFIIQCLNEKIKELCAQWEDE